MADGARIGRVSSGSGTAVRRAPVAWPQRTSWAAATSGAADAHRGGAGPEAVREWRAAGREVALMEREFEGRVALVTGAAGAGIGRAIAHRLAAGGAKVVVTDVHPRRTEIVSRA